jgi:choline dehydrogenase-like flavoprotein
MNDIYLNGQGKKANTYDAIVIGSGISGSWAAKELCEKGLKTLVLERGRLVKHVEDYTTANLDVWDLENRGALTPTEKKAQHKQIRTGFVGKDEKHFFVNDEEHPYEEEKRFDWIRGYQTGGRSLIWGRHCYRWSDLDFEANTKEGIAVDWPIRYKDIEPWYDHVERFVGVSGQKLGLKQLPDGQFLKPMDLNCLEAEVKKRVEKKFPGRVITIGRVAHLTEPLEGSIGRGTCQFRNRCGRGCPYGAYFSANAVTLPAAERTGNMTLRPHSIVHEVMYDNGTGKATGVRIVDEETKESIEYFAPIIFLNASTVGSTSILLNSKSERFPNGMGNDSGELGHNMMDHHYFAGASGKYSGMQDGYYQGRRPNGVYIPRYRNIDEASNTDAFLRGFGYQGEAHRDSWGRGIAEQGFGPEFKEAMTKPGDWTMIINGFGECLPYHENKMYLHPSKKDQWGLPLVVFDAEFKENELQMREQIKTDAAEMLEAGGLNNVETFDEIGGVGKGIHEMGTARMGRDARTSVLNKYNQIHAVPNVYVTDGASMTSSACVNPSITYMALTARAVDHAVKNAK